MDNKKRRYDDRDPYEDIDLSFDIQHGNITQLTEHTKRKIKKRPIGFLANIDEFVDE